MEEAMKEEFDRFLSDMEGGKTYGRYLDEIGYGDDYSHDEIRESQLLFTQKVREWLHEHRPGQFLVSCSYCVFVMTAEEAKIRGVHFYELVK